MSMLQQSHVRPLWSRASVCNRSVYTAFIIDERHIIKRRPSLSTAGSDVTLLTLSEESQTTSSRSLETSSTTWNWTRSDWIFLPDRTDSAGSLREADQKLRQELFDIFLIKITLMLNCLSIWQWWNVPEYIYSSSVLMRYLYLTWVFPFSAYVILLLHFIMSSSHSDSRVKTMTRRVIRSEERTQNLIVGK